MIKKLIVLSLVAILSLASVVPTFARNDENDEKENKGQSMSEVKKEMKKENKEENQESKNEKKEKKELEKALRFAPKTLTLAGKLVSVNTAASTTEITISVDKVWPARPKRLSASSTIVYPEVGKNLTIKVSNKALMVRAYGAKMKVSEMSVGDDLRITAKFNKDGSVEARVIRNNSLHVLLNQKGAVESIDAAGLSFVLKQEKRTLIVKTDAKTKFHLRGSTSTSFADLKVGDKVMVKGIINTNIKVVYASAVTIQRPKLTPAPVPAPTSVPATSTTSTALTTST